MGPMRMIGWHRSGVAVACGIGLLLALSSQLAGTAGAGPSFDGRGRITAIDPGRGTVTIEHGGVAGLLPPTESEFPVQSTSLIQSVRTGDRVRFTLGAADESHGLLTVTSLTAESPAGTGWLDRTMLSIVAALALLTLGTVAIAGLILWRQLQSLQRRVMALDHEAGILRGLVTDTQDGIRQIAHALDEAATALRVGYLQQLRRRLIPGASSAATAESAPDKASGEAATGLIVVQRGRGELYRAVQGDAGGPGVAVIWDRRRSERRRGARRPVGHERRHTERRGAPPEMWTRLGFQVVPGAAEAARTPRVLRSVSGERGASH
jgi:Cu/Ag efflux protein CusF